MRLDPIQPIEAVTSRVTDIVITSGGNVVHVATGAALWLAGAIGLAHGAGEAPLTKVVALLGMTGLASIVQREND